MIRFTVRARFRVRFRFPKVSSKRKSMRAKLNRSIAGILDSSRFVAYLIPRRKTMHPWNVAGAQIRRRRHHARCLHNLAKMPFHSSVAETRYTYHDFRHLLFGNSLLTRWSTSESLCCREINTHTCWKHQKLNENSHCTLFQVTGVGVCWKKWSQFDFDLKLNAISK